MYKIKICKYYKHPKTCTNPNSCAAQLLSNPKFCCSKLYYSMGLEEVNEKYKQALDEIEQTINDFSFREIQEIPQTQVEFTQYLLYVGEAKLRKISGIIYKLRRDNNG